MIRKTMLAAVAASAMMAGSAQATTIFSQNFSGGLGANESVGGGFSVAGGTVGHQSSYYANNEYSFYQVRLDLTKATSALLSFDYDIYSEWTWDGMNLAYSTNGVFSPDRLLNPTVPDLYHALQGRAGSLMGPRGISGTQKGKAGFDLTPLLGQMVDIRFQFASDHLVIGTGVDIDNVMVSGTVPSAVPEPATWAMMIAGFGLAGGAIRSRRSLLATTAA